MPVAFHLFGGPMAEHSKSPVTPSSTFRETTRTILSSLDLSQSPTPVHLLDSVVTCDARSPASSPRGPGSPSELRKRPRELAGATLRGRSGLRTNTSAENLPKFSSTAAPLEPQNAQEPGSASRWGDADLVVYRAVFGTIFSHMSPAAIAVAGSVCRNWRMCQRAFMNQAKSATFCIYDGKDLLHAAVVLTTGKGIKQMHLKAFCKLDDRALAAFVRAATCPLEDIRISFQQVGCNRLVGSGLTMLAMRYSSTLRRLQVEDCSFLNDIKLQAPRLECLHIAGACNLKRFAADCPALRELSLDLMPTSRPWVISRPLTGDRVTLLHFGFSDEALAGISELMQQISECCGDLISLHVSSPILTDFAVDSLLGSNPHELRNVAFTHCPFLTTRSAELLATRCFDLEMVDLSGCNTLSDTAIVSVANAFGDTLTSLHMASCPRVTVQGVEAAAAAAPYLQVLDIGKCPLNGGKSLKLKHDNLEIVSLWGCSGLERLELTGKSLRDVNINGCTGLTPGSFALRSPVLDTIHAKGCTEVLVKAVASKRPRHEESYSSN